MNCCLKSFYMKGKIVVVQHLPNGKYMGRIKINGCFVKSKTFKLKRDAKKWHDAEKERLLQFSNIDVSRRPLGVFVDDFLAHRKGAIRESAFKTEKYAVRRFPEEWSSWSVASFKAHHFTKWFSDLYAQGLAFSTVRRYRDVARAFFNYLCTLEVIPANPVLASKLPRRREPEPEKSPFVEEADLDEVMSKWRELYPQSADVALVLARTGIRWGEARALLVSDFEDGDTPILSISKSMPEGCSVGATKSGKSRRVPVMADAANVLRQFAAQRHSPDDLLLPPLHRSRFIAQLRWEQTAHGRTIHDLRHTAICMWIKGGADLATVRAWAGHSSLEITSRYTHYLGSTHDVNTLQKLNDNLLA